MHRTAVGRICPELAGFRHAGNNQTGVGLINALNAPKGLEHCFAQNASSECKKQFSTNLI